MSETSEHSESRADVVCNALDYASGAYYTYYNCVMLHLLVGTGKEDQSWRLKLRAKSEPGTQYLVVTVMTDGNDTAILRLQGNDLRLFASTFIRCVLYAADHVGNLQLLQFVLELCEDIRGKASVDDDFLDIDERMKSVVSEAYIALRDMSGWHLYEGMMDNITAVIKLLQPTT